ncbi:uncharacterized protein LOC127511058 isoform X2 [Ctenopharyngodon idella]|uniref:uncharacterized protein LOC127511058 isoform X2 n=1 Tax=Ctenopharyngodon idella TaxID=7959 RepID=UPI00222EF7C2|nr:uncharacterized protein LOC127511058 isoform X2 [Ctenopharyngodon idella]
MASETIEVAALGRPLFPGMLYDCRKDTFIPGVTLWDKKSLSEDLDSHQKPMTDLKFSSSDSLSSKSSVLDVSASLKASFLGGLVEVGGSAKYLRDTKSSNQQSRVTMYYKETTIFKQLTMSQLGQITYPAVFEQKTATHVVTAVLYGAQAVMVFDRTFSEEENKQEIEGELNIMVKKIPLFSIEGKGALNMTDGDKKVTESISCTFYGDVRLEKSPTTYIEALEVYKNLPKTMKENSEKAVPIKVWLYPLSLLDTKAAQLVRGITTRLVSYTEDIIEGLLEAERTCNDLSNNIVVNDFKDVKERLSSFQGSLNIYKSVLMKAVARVLPAIRGGEMEEKSLEDILKIHYSSHFKADMLNQWLDDAKFELDLLSSQTKKLEGIKTEDSNRLKILLSDPDIDVLVCLTFTSLKYEDQYLSALKKFLESEEFKKLEVVVKTCSSMFISEEWFNDPDVISKMRENLSLFKGFSEAYKDEKRYRFIISAISDPSSPGSSIYLYEKGKLTDTQFQPVLKPPPPEVKDVKERSVSLKLQKSPTGETVQYRVEYKQVKEEEWHAKNTADEDFTLTELEPETQYLIRYRIVGKVGVSEASDTIGPIEMEKSQKKTIRLCQSAVKDNLKGLRVVRNIKNNWSSKIADGSNENLPMFKLSLSETWKNRDGFCRRSTFGKNVTKQNKTIMMIGATGAGKTTLINSMINYILGVEWEDDFRFVLIDEGKQKSQAESQTSAITAYQINYMDGFQVPYSLTIVDTPGFGDTRGISHDQKIIKKIQEFFSARGGIDRIDAVCFVVQASLARLSHTQKYVFDSILSIFGKDIAENILVLVTFADGKRPPVLEAIKVSEVSCATNESKEPLHFKFNNSAVFVNNNEPAEDEDSDCENFDQMFWMMGVSSMNKFFTSLNTMQTQSLTLTREVLKERQQLEVLVERLQPQINAGLSKLDEIKKTRADLEQHKAEMDANKDFEYEVEVTVPKQIKNTTGYYLMNCQQCHFTCHDTCEIADDSERYNCVAMTDGKCRVCPGKCAWHVHFNQKYKWIYVPEKRKQIYYDLKKRFEAAHGKVTSKEKISEELEKELDIVQDTVTGLIKKSQNSLERLQEIALKPNPLSTPDYIDLMIESEEQEAKPGFKDRIQSLMDVRKKAEIISKVSTGEVLPEDWKTYKLATRKK